MSFTYVTKKGVLLMNSTIYGYARVSTTSQSLAPQKEVLIQNGVHRNNIYADKFTGTKTDRPEFSLLLKEVQSGDTVIVTKLDRFARNTKEALQVIDLLFKKGVSIHVLNLGRIENNPVGKMMYTLLLSVAEMEREMIIERSQEGKAFAKKHKPNYREGRPKATLTRRKRDAYDMLQDHTYKEVSERTEFSISTLHRIRRLIEEEEQVYD